LTVQRRFPGRTRTAEFPFSFLKDCISAGESVTHHCTQVTDDMLRESILPTIQENGTDPAQAKIRRRKFNKINASFFPASNVRKHPAEVRLNSIPASTAKVALPASLVRRHAVRPARFAVGPAPPKVFSPRISLDDTHPTEAIVRKCGSGKDLWVFAAAWRLPRRVLERRRRGRFGEISRNRNLYKCSAVYACSGVDASWALRIAFGRSGSDVVE